MQPVSFSCKRGELTIRGEYQLPDQWTDGMRCPALFMSHGFGGNCQNMHNFAVPFLEHGYVTFWYDFCGGCVQGMSDGRMEDMCFASECADLNAVIEYAKTLPFVDGGHLALLGESMGGAISSLVAAQNTHAIQDLVLISPALCVADDARNGCLGGAVYSLNDVPETLLCPNGMKLSRRFQEEVVQLDQLEALKPYKGRVLLIHGVADSVVPYVYALKAREAYGDRCDLHLVEQMDHCCMNPDQMANALRVIRQHLLGKREVLTIQVQITGAEQLSPGGEKLEKPVNWETDSFINAVYFTGYARCDSFTGAIRHGAVDRQTFVDGKQIQLCADYTLFGMDAAGQRCNIHVVNRGVNGDWHPTVETDSKQLSFLNGADLTAVLDMHAGGLTVSIYG